MRNLKELLKELNNGKDTLERFLKETLKLNNGIGWVINVYTEEGEFENIFQACLYDSKDSSYMDRLEIEYNDYYEDFDLYQRKDKERNMIASGTDAVIHWFKK